MKKLLKYLKPYKFSAISGMTCKFIEAILELFTPLIMARIIDNGRAFGTAYIVKNIAIMAAIVFVGYALAFYCQKSAATVGANFGCDIRRDLYKNINTFSYSELDNLDSNTLLTSITNDITNVQMSVSVFIRLATRAPFITLGALAMAFSINKPISLIFLFIIPVVAFILFYIMKKSIALHKKTLESLDKITQSTRENLDGVRVIRAYNKQADETQEFEGKNQEYLNNSVKMTKLLSLNAPLSSLVVNICCAIIVYIGGKFVNFGSLQAGQVTALTTYLFQILLSLTILANLGINFTKAESSASRINKILDAKSSIIDIEKPVENLNDVLPSIEFVDVSFRYQN
ncbi:MAG: ABC transporter permease, partial [Clostridia bacterium]